MDEQSYLVFPMCSKYDFNSDIFPKGEYMISLIYLYGSTACNDSYWNSILLAFHTG